MDIGTVPKCLAVASGAGATETEDQCRGARIVLKDSRAGQGVK